MEQKKDQIQKKALLPSERFTNAIVQEYSSNVGGNSTALTSFHKRLCQNYFINIDIALKKAEVNRLRKNEKNRDNVPITWDNVNMPQLAIDVVACARVGLDIALDNQVHAIPYKNNSTGKYDINLMVGYRGKELVTKKYGLDGEVPDRVIIRIVYKNDTFIPIFKDIDNDIEKYSFKPADNPFNRGDVDGGFWYFIYNDEPTKNKLEFRNKAWIDKRKPTYASPEFWSGTRDKWENGKKVGTEEVEGYYEEMVFKTLYRAAYNSITIDSQKIDDDFMRLSSMEQEHNDNNVKNQITENANKTEIKFEDAEDVTEINAEQPKSQQEPAKHDDKPAENKEVKQDNLFDNQQSKPDF